MNMIEELFNRCRIDSRKLINYLHGDKGFTERIFEWIFENPQLMPNDITWMLINACVECYTDNNINKLLSLYQPNGIDYDYNELILTTINHNKSWVLKYILDRYQLPIKTHHVLQAIKKDQYELIELFVKNGWNPDIKLTGVYSQQSKIITTLIKLQENYNLDPFVMLVGMLTSSYKNIDKLFN